MRAIDLSDQVALILGVANQRSLAWAIAEALGEAGCDLAFTCQGERLKKKQLDFSLEVEVKTGEAAKVDPKP